MVIDITPDEIIDFGTKRLWNVLLSIKNEENGKIDIEEYDKIKNGIRIMCPIWYFTEEWYVLHPSSKKVTIKGYGKYKMSDFMDEKEQRDTMIRKIIIENIDNQSPVEGRV